MSLKDVVDTHERLGNCWKVGMRALAAKDKKFIGGKKGICSGSINIDVCLKNDCAKSNRWDYGLAVNNRGGFVEVHPACTGEVKTMLKKLQWLKRWFSLNCTGFRELEKSFYWIASGRIAIQKSAPQAKLVAKSGLLGPKKYVDLGTVRKKEGCKDRVEG